MEKGQNLYMFLKGCKAHLLKRIVLKIQSSTIKKCLLHHKIIFLVDNKLN